MVALNAPIWEERDENGRRKLSSAGGGVKELLRRLLENDGDFRENVDILAENLYHQLSWYSATAYVLPHLGVLCGTLDDADCLYLIAHMGAAIAAEAEWPLEEGTEAYREFHEGLAILSQETRRLLLDPSVRPMLAEDLELTQQFALSALSILGDRRHAYDLWLLSASCWQDGLAACVCGWNDEELPLLETDCIIPAQIAPWDGKSLTDETVWLAGLLALAGDDQITPALPRVYGTGVCPECGRQEPYWAWLERFMEDY